MQILHILVAAAVAVLPMASAADRTMRSEQTTTLNGRVTRSDPVLVRSVVDGDTIDVAPIGRVRLLGIAAPTIGRRLETSAPFGSEARDRLTALVLHRWVRLERDGVARAAYVMTEDGGFVNATLVREGLARVSARGPLTRLAELQRAESEAQAFRRGMWGSAPHIPVPSYTARSKPRRPPTSRSKTSTSNRSATPKKRP